MKRSVGEIAALMRCADPAVQLRQTEFRSRLVEAWAIPEGARVLEIGCGQGDTTAVLAEAVGPEGRVVAVDPADPSYGAPVTIGDSTRHLADGPLGDRIDFRLSFDVLAGDFEESSFDMVVLAHSSWYFASLDLLAETLHRARAWAPRLCLSEWDLQPRSIEQLGHFLAITIQGQVEAFRAESVANVRSPYSRERLTKILNKAEWTVGSETIIDAPDLDDARWEADMALSLDDPGLPPRLKSLVGSQLDVLRRLPPARPLSSFALIAHRKG